MEINRDTKIKLELDFIDASVLVEAITTGLDKLIEESSMESVLKYAVLRGIGKDLVDQVLSEDEQESLRKKFEQGEMILQALKKEKGG